MTKSANWGGKREGSGRKVSDQKKLTKVVRVDVDLVELIEELKKRYQSGVSINDLLGVTLNQDELGGAVDSDFVAKLQETIKAHKETMRTREVAYNEISAGLQHEIKCLKSQPLICQKIKVDGNQCTKRATHEFKSNGFVFHVCGTHYK